GGGRGGGDFGGGHFDGGLGGGRLGDGLGGGHPDAAPFGAGRVPGDTHGFSHLGHGRPFLDHGPAILPSLYRPDGPHYPVDWYDARCNPCSPYHTPQDC